MSDPNERRLYLKPTCGLCNRWRALLSGVAVAEATRRRLVVCWESQKYCNCPLSFLWKTFPGIEISPEAWSSVQAVDTSPTDIATLAPTDTPAIRLGSFSAFSVPGMRSWAEHDTQLHPSILAQRLINEHGPRIYDSGRKVVAVVARLNRQSHWKTLRNSPQSWFMQRMREILRVYPKTLFLLALDSKQSSLAFHQAFPENVYEVPKATYDFGEGWVSLYALADVHLMKRADYVLGSYYSSYAEMPSMLNPQLPLETSQQKPPQPL